MISALLPSLAVWNMGTTVVFEQRRGVVRIRVWVFQSTERIIAYPSHIWEDIVEQGRKRSQGIQVLLAEWGVTRGPPGIPLKERRGGVPL